MQKKTGEPNTVAALAPAQRRRLVVGAGAWVLWWLILAIAPLDRGDWLLENMLVVVAVVALALTWRRIRLSEASHWLIGLFLALHVLGAHYTYAETPVGFWIQNLLDLSRNHFDRVVHFSFGLLLARPLLELIESQAGTRGLWAYAYAFTLVAAASTLYELLEWVVASFVDPAAALAWLGTQGDPFDAQKDTGLAIIGAFLALIAEAFIRQRRT